MGPGIRENVVVDRPVESTDLVPTLGRCSGFRRDYPAESHCLRLYNNAAERTNAEQFSVYPPEARKFAADHVRLLRQLPLAFVPLVLRELIALTGSFLLSAKRCTASLLYLERLSPEQLTDAMRPFSDCG